MKENENKVAGFSFSNAHDYKEAKREEETIEYIKANTDLNDLNKGLKLYYKLVERKTLKTVVGHAFLKELQEKIIKAGIVTKENMPCIQVDRDEKTLKTFANDFEKEQEKKHLAMVEEYRIRHRNARIINIFLTVIIIFMIAISIWSDRSVFSIFENKIIDKYSTWEEELNKREKAIEEKENIQLEE